MPGRATRRGVDVFVEIPKGPRAKDELAAGSGTASTLIDRSKARA